jgi:hypothetical protein
MNISRFIHFDVLKTNSVSVCHIDFLNIDKNSFPIDIQLCFYQNFCFQLIFVGFARLLANNNATFSIEQQYFENNFKISISILHEFFIGLYVSTRCILDFLIRGFEIYICFTPEKIDFENVKNSNSIRNF